MNNKLFESTTDGLKLDYMAVYSEFMINQQFDDRRLIISALDEDTKLLEGSELISLNEGFIATIIDFLKKLVNNIANVINRFTADFKKLAGLDSKFLADNANALANIKTISVGDKIVNYRNYTQAYEAINNTNGPLQFKSIGSFDDLERNADAWQTVPEYVNSVRLAGITGYDKNDQVRLKDKIINKFVPEPQTIMDEKLTTNNQNLWTQMYNFCSKGFDAALESIKKDKEAINKNNDMITEKLDQLKRGENNTNAVPQQAQQSQQQTETQEATHNTYEDAYRYYFNEADDNPAAGGNATVTGGPNQGTTHNINNDKKENTGGMKIENNDNNEDKTKQDKNKKLSNAIQSFYNANSQLLSAKMKMCTNMYKQYMRLLRWYIQRSTVNAAKTDEEDNKTETGGTIHI